MAALRVLCWALIFILRLRFPPGSSINNFNVETQRKHCRLRNSKFYQCAHAASSFALELVVLKHFAGEFLHEEPCSRLDV